MKPLKLLLPCFILISLYSCNCIIKKRLYMSGYHVDWLDFKKGATHNHDHDSYSVSAYDALSLKPIQETCINASMPSEIYCNEGTTIHIPADAFIYENGKAIQCNKVCVHTWEFYSLSDIIASGLTTTSRNKIIFSSGMIYIEATCCGERLQLKPGKKITVEMPAAGANEKMKMFSGKIQKGIIDWTARGNAKIQNQAFEENSDTLEYSGERIFSAEYSPEASYLMKVSKLGWINCDRFYDVKEKTNLFVKADTNRKTYVAIIFKEIKSVLPGYYNPENAAEFDNVPAGKDVTVLAYRINEKTRTAVVGIQDITLGDTKRVDLSMSEMSTDEFKTLLKQFN